MIANTINEASVWIDKLEEEGQNIQSLRYLQIYNYICPIFSNVAQYYSIFWFYNERELCQHEKIEYSDLLSNYYQSWGEGYHFESYINPGQANRQGINIGNGYLEYQKTCVEDYE